MIYLKSQQLYPVQVKTEPCDNLEEVVPKEPVGDDDDDCQIVMEVKKFKVPLLTQVKIEPLDNTSQADIQVVQGDSTPEKDQHTDEISNDLDKVITICVFLMVLPCCTWFIYMKSLNTIGLNFERPTL